jgi:transposase, IS5 family
VLISLRKFATEQRPEADKLLDDDELIDVVYEAQSERHDQSLSRGHPQTPAEIVLRLLLLKHVRN